MRLVLDGVGKAFRLRDGRRLPVLRDVSLAVEGREFCCLVGPSGCGKSTILNIVAGLVTPDEGAVRADGSPFDRRRVRIGYVFQKPRLLNWRTAADNVVFALRAAGVDARESRHRARHYLELVGLGAFADEFPLALSGGMQQRVAIARALAIEPDLLLMDEPFRHLDELTARTLRAELLGIWERTGTPVLFVTHNALEAVYLADRVVVLGSRPATVLEELSVAVPRAREMEDPRLVALHRVILNSLGIDGGR
jgi:ABC-type nitrate/sulfonate/bicarbonate transport system ATPase subunit